MRMRKVHAQGSSPCATHCLDREVCNYTNEYHSSVFERLQDAQTTHAQDEVEQIVMTCIELNTHKVPLSLS